MPPLEVIFIYGMILATVISAWEAVKAARHSWKERHSTWISFETPEGARAAAKRVDNFYGDSGKRADTRVVWLRTNKPRIEVRVPNAMLTYESFDSAVDNFRTGVERAVEK